MGFGQISEPKWIPGGPQNASKIHQKTIRLHTGDPFGVQWSPWIDFGMVLVFIWHQFGAILVTLSDFFDRFRTEFLPVFQQVGIISASLLLLIHWFIFRPFISELMDQPTRFHLVSPVRSHTIRSVYFRPISEFH